MTSASSEKRRAVGGTPVGNFSVKEFLIVVLSLMIVVNDCLIAWSSFKLPHLLNTSGVVLMHVTTGRNLGIRCLRCHKGLCTLGLPYICGILYVASFFIESAFLK